jgi:hypothetical protein
VPTPSYFKYENILISDPNIRIIPEPTEYGYTTLAKTMVSACTHSRYSQVVVVTSLFINPVLLEPPVIIFRKNQNMR